MDDELTLSKEGHSGELLRLSGYYYYRANGKVFGSEFFYTDGVYLDAGGAAEGIEELDEYLHDEILVFESYKETKYRWGQFSIQNDTIRFERWFASSGGPLKVFVKEGLIINDTTFLITRSYRHQNNRITETKPRSELYHFRAFTPKPDSTNDYVN